MLKADLHSHSTYSDGTLTPSQLVAAARAHGLGALALTDHDTVEGLPEFYRAGEGQGFRVLGGTELSLEFLGTTHMLGYRLGPSPAPELDLSFLQHFREERNTRILGRLGAMGIAVSQERLEAIAGGGVAGKPHIALALMEMGLVEARQEAFDRFLGRGKPAYVEKKRLNARDGIRLLLDSDYAPVLAHPHSLGVGPGEYGDVLAILKAWGLVGVEAFHPDNPEGDTLELLRVAGRLGLVVTNGSDFHGANKRIPLCWVKGHSPLGLSVIKALEGGLRGAKSLLRAGGPPKGAGPGSPRGPRPARAPGPGAPLDSLQA
jgi:predicted metal-dependent phosphoesterase TrpH